MSALRQKADILTLTTTLLRQCTSPIPYEAYIFAEHFLNSLNARGAKKRPPRRRMFKIIQPRLKPALSVAHDGALNEATHGLIPTPQSLRLGDDAQHARHLL